MTEVLGLTDALPPCGGRRLRRIGDLSMVTAPVRSGRTPRDRLRLQVACATELPSFLPFAPAGPSDAGDVESWLATRSDMVAQWLERVRGRVQLAVLVHPGRRQRPERPADWLRQRAEVVRLRKTATNVLAERALGLGAVDAACRAEAGRLDLLCDLDRLGGLVAGLRVASSPSLGPPVRAHVTGPWPVFGFGPAGRCS
jgi:hypothetical protein